MAYLKKYIIYPTSRLALGKTKKIGEVIEIKIKKSNKRNNEKDEVHFDVFTSSIFYF